MARKGERLTQAQREKLSHLAVKRHQKAKAERKGDPSHKRCSKCGELKSLEFFYMFKRKLVSGEVAFYPQSRCKECDIGIRQRNWERLRGEGVDLAALKRRYEANEDQERRRQRWRENQAILRRKAGLKVLGSKRGAKPLAAGERLPTGPIVGLLAKEFDLNGEPANQYANKGLGLLSERSGVPPRRIYGLMHGEYDRVALSTVDKLLVGMGLPHMLPILYPET